MTALVFELAPTITENAPETLPAAASQALRRPSIPSAASGDSRTSPNQMSQPTCASVKMPLDRAWHSSPASAPGMNSADEMKMTSAMMRADTIHGTPNTQATAAWCELA
jgi:hypothetical protein